MAVIDPILSTVRWLCAAAIVLAAAGCATQAQRPYMAGEFDRNCSTAADSDPSRTTPERAQGYALHFVEFDDQGWAFPNEGNGRPGLQIDCAIADLKARLESPRDRKVVLFVYVHGWKHSAADDDGDLDRFRKLLASRVPLFEDRDVVGIYVGWQGRTMDEFLGLENLNFWARKNAAGRVADGRVRELFSRIRGLRAYWNTTAQTTTDCGADGAGNDGCRLRTVMIGHSFGGLILFNSAEPYLLEAVSIDRDLPAGVRRQRPPRSRSIADLIVLLNPAFEGSRFEPLFEASQRYQTGRNEPPMLVMITSSADRATKNAFPIARWFNTILQYPSSSDDQSSAMRRTPGHIDRFLTHELCHGGAECAKDEAWAPAAGRELGPLHALCDGLALRSYAAADGAARPIIWNVRTDASVIKSHGDIDGPAVVSFVEQIYGSVTRPSGLACADGTHVASVLP